MSGEPLPAARAAWALSADGRTLVISCRRPAGVQTVTLRRQDGAGPFTDADITAALATVPSGRMQPGQRNTTRRVPTRLGILWLHVMTGPPTWLRPQARRERDGTVMAGWLRLAVAAKLDRGGG